MSDLIFQIKNLGFKPNDLEVLKDITFNVYKGESITVTGPSGSGKSTLLKLMANMIMPTSGEIYYKEKLMLEYSPTEYRKEVSYIFQNAQLFDQTVRDNLSFPYYIRNEELDEETALESLERVQLPRNYLDKPVTELSGGEKQRISFIRNLQFFPNVLLLDEVTSSLDQQNREVLLELIRQLNEEEELTMLMITHNEDEIAESNRMLTIIDGKVEER